MSIELPGPLVWVIDLLGYNWPEADEDKLFDSARQWRAFAAELRDVTADAGKIAADVGYNNVGDEIDAFTTAWRADDEHRSLGAEAADLTAVLLDAAGTATQATKIAIITILAVTAAEIIAAQAAAPETLGASEAGAIAAEEAGRYAVRRALNKLREHAERDLAGALRREIEDRLRRINPPENRLGIMESRARGGGGRGTPGNRTLRQAGDRLTRRQQRDQAAELGYAPYKPGSPEGLSHDQPIFYNKDAGPGEPRYISYDRDGHGSTGEVTWKGAQKPGDLASNATRDGTYVVDRDEDGRPSWRRFRK